MMKYKNIGKLIVVSGPSGAGKGTIIDGILKRNENIKFSISATTREKRENEIDTIHYYFLKRNDFLDKIKNNEFIEYARVHNGEYYGTLKSEVEKEIENGNDVILDIDSQGAKSIKKTFKNAIYIFVVTPSEKDYEKRLYERNTENEKNIKIRLKNGKKEMKKIDLYDYVIINDKLDKSIEDFETILKAEKLKLNYIEKEL